MEPVKINKVIRSLNPVTGCPYECDYCYAKKVNDRYKVISNFSNPQFFEQRLRKLYTRKPTLFFLTSMSDFSIWEPEWMDKILQAIEKNPHNTFLLLTKHPELIDLSTKLRNLWVGVTVTNSCDKKRIQVMKKHLQCENYFVTFEPLFENIGELDFDGIGWIVVGTETGNRKGKINAHKDWVVSICQQARTKEIPVFMKESLVTIVGENLLLQELPANFTI